MKFNFTNKGKDTTVNHEGEKTYRMSAELELYSAVATSMVDGTFYESSSDRLDRIKDLVAKCNPEFVAKLAVYARTKMNLRSISVVLVVELARQQSGNQVVKKAVTAVVRRADEIKEVLAYYQMSNKREGTKKLNRLSKQIQKGLADSFNNFDEYQFAKYNSKAEVSLRDALFLVHPKAKDETQQVLFDKIVNDELSTPYTWEVELSELGKRKFDSAEVKAKAVADKWEELVFSGKLGYMALLRNLRNILEANVSKECIIAVCEKLGDADAVRKSKQFPFRFLSAYREIKIVKSCYVSRVLDALEQAVLASAENIQGFGDDVSVLLACDVSGSMQRSVSARSKVKSYDIGLMLAMLLKCRNKDAITGLFGDIWKIVNVPTTGILSNVEAFYRREGEVGYSTNGYLVIQDLLDRKFAVDKVMIFTDMQLWNTKDDTQIAALWRKYKAMFPNSKLYLFDLSGYGNTPLSVTDKDVYLIAGWSDKIFDMLAALEGGSDALAEIDKIEL